MRISTMINIHLQPIHFLIIFGNIKNLASTISPSNQQSNRTAINPNKTKIIFDLFLCINELSLCDKVVQIEADDSEGGEIEEECYAAACVTFEVEFVFVVQLDAVGVGVEGFQDAHLGGAVAGIVDIIIRNLGDKQQIIFFLGKVISYDDGLNLLKWNW